MFYIHSCLINILVKFTSVVVLHNIIFMHYHIDISFKCYSIFKGKQLQNFHLIYWISKNVILQIYVEKY